MSHWHPAQRVFKQAVCGPQTSASTALDTCTEHLHANHWPAIGLSMVTVFFIGWRSKLRLKEVPR
jgi:hypothetical protein